MPLLAALSFGGACHQGPLQGGPGGDPVEDAAAGLSATMPASLPPEATPRPPGVQAALAQSWRQSPPGPDARTRHKQPDGRPLFTNRLLLESSPYLRQHAHNPVDWHPWGDEAFALAAELGRPVLLSVGYATCHWCHVMEEESFEDLEIAAWINAHMVPIKVDREERPDVDSVYMTAVQLMTGRGGWPMTVWMGSDRQPYYAGTYFPARDGDRGRSVGFLTVLKHMDKVHREQPAEVARVKAQLTEGIAAQLEAIPQAPDPQVDLGPILQAAEGRYLDRADPVWGGTKGAPKFPSSQPLRLLLRTQARTGKSQALVHVRATLDGMAAGGMRDHLAGGFHRYSTDDRWLVPHFEKMLYDNAQLVWDYIEGWQITGDPRYAAVARDTLAWMDRDMSTPRGSFYAATDADSVRPDGEVEEGWYFSWTPAELNAVLGPQDGPAYAALVGATEAGNFEGRNVLHRMRGVAEVSGETGMDTAALEALAERARAPLLTARSERPAPLRDDKELLEWNALSVSAFALAGFALADPALVQRAVRAGDAAWAHVIQGGDGPALRSRTGERWGPLGYLEDHAALVAACLDLYEATADARWLQRARDLQARQEAHFSDTATGAWWRTAHSAPVLLVRERPFADGATPSGSSLSLRNLVRLHAITSDPVYAERALAHRGAVGPRLAKEAVAASELLIALDLLAADPRQVVLVAPQALSELEPFTQVLRAGFYPHRVLIRAVEGLAGQPGQPALLAGKVALGGQPTAYVCRGGVCDLPTTDVAQFAQQLAD